MSTLKPLYGSNTALAVTALQSLANSATAGWKSALIDNTANLADDYEIFVKLTTANTAPASPATASVYICPASYDGSAWNYSDAGTTTLPSSGDAAYTVAFSSITSANDLVLLGTLSYATQNMTMQKTMLLSSVFATMPQGFSIIIINNTGAALSTSCVVNVLPIQITVA
jgi:hypothetical protein